MGTRTPGTGVPVEAATPKGDQVAAGGGTSVATSPEPVACFISLYDVGLRLVDSGRRIPTRQTLIRRGAEFAGRNGLTVHEIGRDRYVSTAELDRVHRGTAA